MHQPLDTYELARLRTAIASLPPVDVYEILSHAGGVEASYNRVSVRSRPRTVADLADLGRPLLPDEIDAMRVVLTYASQLLADRDRRPPSRSDVPDGGSSAAAVPIGTGNPDLCWLPSSRALPVQHWVASANTSTEG